MAASDPYVPRLARSPELFDLQGFRTIDATLLFADVSGYTRLSERLSLRGREGSERLTEVINGCFSTLIDHVSDFGGDVLRFGGDALLCAFVGGEPRDRIHRGITVARLMQNSMGQRPSLDVPGGRVRLRMSIGVHDGPLHLYRWSGSWIETVPMGPTVNETLACEAAATHGSIQLSNYAASIVGDQFVTAGGTLRTRMSLPRVTAAIAASQPTLPLTESAPHVPTSLLTVTSEVAMPEHRAVAVSFVTVTTPEHCFADSMSCDLLAADLDRLFITLDRVAEQFGVVPLATDVAPGGLKIILVAGVPTASEDDPERLVAAARALVVAMPQLCSAGAHLGLAFAGDVGHPQRRAFSVMGDTVNLAARLAAKSRLGTVLISRQLATALDGTYDLDWLDPFFVKGKAAAQHAALVGNQPILAVNKVASGSIIGRADELGELTRAMSEPGLVEVIGTPGAGATSLIRNVTNATSRSIYWVTASVEDRGRVLAVANQVLRSLGGSAATSTVEAVARTLEHWPNGGILVIDRGHNADEPSLAVLRMLSVSLAGTNRSIVMAHRGLTEVLATTSIVLDALDEQSLRAIAIDRATQPLSDASVNDIARRSGGNPAHAIFLAQSTVADRELAPSFESALTAQLDRYPPLVRTILRESATVGPALDTAQVASILDRPLTTVNSAFLTASDIVERVSDTRFVFRSEALREVASAGLTVRQRQALHARAVRHLEQADHTDALQIAHHAWFADVAGDGYIWNTAAAITALDGGASSTATTLATRARQCLARLDAPWQQHVDSAILESRCAQAAALPVVQAHALRFATTACADLSQRADLMVQRARLARLSGSPSVASRFLNRANALLADTEPPPEDVIVAAQIEAAWQSWYRGHQQRALAFAQQAANDAADLQLAAQQVLALGLIEEIYSTTGHPDAEAAGAAALVAARASDDRPLLARLLPNLALTADNRGDWRRAVAMYDEALESLGQDEDVLTRAAILRNIASIRVELGEVDSLVETLRTAIRVEAAAGYRQGLAVAQSMAIRVASRRGLPASPADLAMVASAIDQLRMSAATESADFQQLGLIECLLLSGLANDAARSAADLLARVEQIYPDSHLLPSSVRRMYGMSLAAIGDIDDGRTLIAAGQERADRGMVEPEQLFCRIALWQLDGSLGDTDQALVALLAERIGMVSLIRYPLLRSSSTDR